MRIIKKGLRGVAIAISCTDKKALYHLLSGQKVTSKPTGFTSQIVPLDSYSLCDTTRPLRPRRTSPPWADAELTQVSQYAIGAPLIFISLVHYLFRGPEYKRQERSCTILSPRRNAAKQEREHAI